MSTGGSEVADFRSDTVTRPSPAMRKAMAEAEVGDDVLDGDPTVARLERRVAGLPGKDGALFVPSGTMANQVALGAWTRPGDELIAERNAHIVTREAGAPGALHGLQCLTLIAEDGRLDLTQVRASVRARSVHCPRTALVCVEQTFMGSGAGPGGRVLPLEHLQALHALAREQDLRVHMDGARLLHACVATGIAAARYAACADSVSICMSKGLGAPVGSLIAGPREFLERARLVRKRLGGWMRQAGVLASAALHALEHNVERLAADHALARALAEVLHGRGFACPPGEVETNIVMARVAPGSAEAWVQAFRRESVLVLPMSPDSLRFVTHLDVGERDVRRLGAALKSVAP